MDCIVLAGGLGTRLREVIPNLPKPLAPVGGKPFLELLLQKLATFGQIENMILAVSYLAEKIEAYILHHAYPFPVLFSVEKKPLGTGGGLKKALTLARAEDVLVLNGDSYLDLDYGAFYQFHLTKNADLSIACVHMENSARFGQIVLDKKTDTILQFHEKKQETFPGWINGGVYLLKKKILDSFNAHLPFSLEKEGFPNFLGKKMYGYACKGTFIDIGTKESFEEAQQIFHEEIS